MASGSRGMMTPRWRVPNVTSYRKCSYWKVILAPVLPSTMRGKGMVGLLCVFVNLSVWVQATQKQQRLPAATPRNQEAIGGSIFVDLFTSLSSAGRPPEVTRFFFLPSSKRLSSPTQPRVTSIKCLFLPHKKKMRSSNLVDKLHDTLYPARFI